MGEILLYLHVCRSQSLLYVLAPFTGRSDYGPFIAEGTDIPGMHHPSYSCTSRSEGLVYRLKEFNGRSDYGPFIAEGVNIPGNRATIIIGSLKNLIFNISIER